jgi:hypothetical protein
MGDECSPELNNRVGKMTMTKRFVMLILRIRPVTAALAKT